MLSTNIMPITILYMFDTKLRFPDLMKYSGTEFDIEKFQIRDMVHRDMKSISQISTRGSHSL